jgi:hypothetical protein
VICDGFAGVWGTLNANEIHFERPPCGSLNHEGVGSPESFSDDFRRVNEVLKVL